MSVWHWHVEASVSVERLDEAITKLNKDLADAADTGISYEFLVPLVRAVKAGLENVDQSVIRSLMDEAEDLLGLPQKL